MRLPASVARTFSLGALTRRLWDTLAMVKKGRTILLTTHFMDEAEVLGDRVGIMKDGKLACEGTPLELKHRYDCGYELLVQQALPKAPPGRGSNPMHEAEPARALRPNLGGGAGSAQAPAAAAAARELEAFVLAGVPGAHRHPLHPVPSEMRFTLPLAARNTFGEFLAALEARSGALRVVNYGISMAPFEEVFLRVGAESSVTRSQLKAKRPSLTEGAATAATAAASVAAEGAEGGRAPRKGAPQHDEAEALMHGDEDMAIYA